jgi:hypothetical protein
MKIEEACSSETSVELIEIRCAISQKIQIFVSSVLRTSDRTETHFHHDGKGFDSRNVLYIRYIPDDAVFSPQYSYKEMGEMKNHS